ncbi:MAG: MBL fold metallo-hydrolase [Blastochloris sp.]|nr:MBL fold metallo-hydrolase [Blastochloris sp.]
MKIKIWGTRGSIPTPSNSSFVTTRYGGDTTCVSIDSGEHRIILDGGTGLRLLGLEMMKENRPWDCHFFFSHVHWDHIQGFPFFLPSFTPGNRFTLYGPRLMSLPGFVGSILEKALRGQQEDLNFPVQLKDMPAEMIFKDLDDRSVITLPGKKSSVKILSAALNHPGGCYGYRIEEHVPGERTKVFTFATDTEHLKTVHPNLQFLAKDADVLLYDGQYTPEEYEGINGMDHKGWGHSTYEWGLKEAQAAGVKLLLLHHHDPLHDDDKVAEIEAAARALAQGTGIEVEAGAQMREIEI